MQCNGYSLNAEPIHDDTTNDYQCAHVLQVYEHVSSSQGITPRFLNVLQFCCLWFKCYGREAR